MVQAKKDKAADFRYATGPARVPWAAVGERIETAETQALLEFLFPPKEGKEKAHAAALGKVKDDLAALAQVSSRAGKLSLGGQVKALEAESAKYLKCKHACFLTNATAGFEIGFRWANLGPGDEVIAPAITFIATIAYPLAIGAKVVLSDVDPATLNMDPADVARKVTKKTKAIIPVHIGGYPVDMDPIMKLARQRGITVIEDAAHGLGGAYKGKMLGAIGHFGSFSCHEVKNVNSLGEGGLLVTNLPAGKQFPQMRFLGLDPSKKIKNWLYDVVAANGRYGPFACNNSSSTEVQALVLRHQMKRLDRIIRDRRRVAAYLTGRLSKVKGLIPQLLDTRHIKATYHLYLIQVDPDVLGADVQVFKKKLSDRGVTNIPHFGPLYKFSVMRQLGYDTREIEESCPNAEMVFSKRFTHLPLYGLAKDQVKYMADAVIESAQEMRAGR